MKQEKTKPKQLPRKRVSVIRTLAVREKSVLYEGRCIRTPEDAVRLIHPFVVHAGKEHLIVCCLDGKNQPVSVEVVAVGTVNQCPAQMREIFKNAVLSNAVSIILFHNHPSGDCSPSEEDVLFSQRLRKAGELLGIPVLDHMILGQDSFKSLADTLEWRTWTEGSRRIA